MIRKLISMAAMAACLPALCAATPDLELSLTADAFQGGWDSKYFEADHTIQFTKEYGGNGWYWYDGQDFSAYDQVVVEYASRGPEINVVVGYLGTEAVSESRFMPANYDQAVVDLDPALRDKVLRVMITGSAPGYVTIKRAYLRVRPEVDPSVPVVLFEGAQALDWWEHNVTIYPSAFSGIQAGDRIVVDYTGNGSAGGGSADCIFKLDYRLMINYEYVTKPLPGTESSPYFKEGGLHMEEYDGEQGTFTHELTDADVEALKNPNLDCLFITGAHCIINKVMLRLSPRAGIDSVEADTKASGAPRYYDLQGRAVQHPAAGSLYLRVWPDGHADKVMLR